MNFQELHQQKVPLLICNVWDVMSAKAAETSKFEAIGTSSGAIASMLGYRDGEEMSFQELIYIVNRIRQSTYLPLSVDLEAGYSRAPAVVVDHIRQLIDIGVVGVNIEDSLVEGKRNMVDSDQFCKTLEAIGNLLSKQRQNIFINVRTDTFLLDLPNRVSETIIRAKKYQDAGAQGIFVPCIETAADIRKVITEIELPLNVMCMPKLPGFSDLASLGVQRISMGNFTFLKMKKSLEYTLKMIQKEKSFKNIFID